LNQIGLGFYELVLMFGKCPRNSVLFEMRFLKRNDVGLGMHDVYVITKNGFDQII